MGKVRVNDNQREKKNKEKIWLDPPEFEKKIDVVEKFSKNFKADLKEILGDKYKEPK